MLGWFIKLADCHLPLEQNFTKVIYLCIFLFLQIEKICSVVTRSKTYGRETSGNLHKNSYTDA